MKLADFRAKYPEYDDISDSDLRSKLNVELEDEQNPILPALHSIEAATVKLQEVIAENKPKEDTTTFELLKQIKNQLVKLETAINKIDVQPMITVQSPMVNIPKTEIPAVVIPEPLKEWTFDVVDRGPYGNIKTVVARAT